jgi:hypothetical protein
MGQWTAKLLTQFSKLLNQSENLEQIAEYEEFYYLCNSGETKYLWLIAAK